MKIKNLINVEKLYFLNLKIRKSLLNYLDRKLFDNKEIDIKDTILILGSPRSGTSWLMFIMAAIPDYTYLFEPLQPHRFPKSVETGFKSRTYIKPDINWPKGEDYLERVFTGKIVSKEPIYEFKLEMIMSRFLSNKLIVKSVRMNRMLPWVVEKFPLKKTLFIIRHPCAVVASQIKTGWCGYHSSQPPYKDIFPKPKDIVKEASNIQGLRPEILNKLKKMNSLEETLAAAWCLDQYVPLSQPKSYPWTAMTYEHLVKNGIKAIKPLFEDLGEQKVPRSINKFLDLPADMVKRLKSGAISDRDKQLSKWKKNLSEKQIKKILKIVEIFDMDFYSEKIMPDLDHPLLKNVW